jgi:hypothetical protein
MVSSASSVEMVVKPVHYGSDMIIIRTMKTDTYAPRSPVIVSVISHKKMFRGSPWTKIQVQYVDFTMMKQPHVRPSAFTAY